ncbi:MAG: nuclear transport factor 2 family protein [Anaerolineales bacterium]|nr:nuclear transport factor 2 family protein [Anaerolineales bacterium]
MSEFNENVQVVQDLYAAFGQGDMAGLLTLLAEDVDWTFNGRREDIPFAGRWQGRGEMMDFFRTVGETCDVLAFGPNEVIALGEHVLSLGHERVRVRATGREFESDWAHLFTVQDGQVVRLREYYDTAVMAEAFLAK